MAKSKYFDNPANLQGAVSAASRYAPEESAPRKTLVQEAKRRLKMRKRRKNDKKRYEAIMAKKNAGQLAGSHYSADADKVYRNVKAGKYD